MDIGAFLITSIEEGIHAKIVELMRAYISARGGDASATRLAYGFDPQVPGAIVVSVLSGDGADVYRWHSEHADLGGELAKGLGVEVWCVTRERRTGFVEGVCFDKTGDAKSRVAEESDHALTACARSVRASKAAVTALLELERETAQHALADEVDPTLLDAVVRTVQAEAVAPKVRAKTKPKQTERKPTLPKTTTMRAAKTPAESPDEDLFKVPRAWADIVDRRRGGWFLENELRPDAADSFARVRAAWDRIASQGRWLLFEGTPKGSSGRRIPELIDAVTSRFASGRALGTVELEAATSSMLRSLEGGCDDGESAIVDWWVSAGDLSFAVESLLRAMEYAVAFQRSGQSGTSYSLPVFGPPLGVARALRRHLASAPEDRFDLARARCAELRPSLGVAGLYAAAYLFPSEPTWHEALTSRSDEVGTRDWADWPMASWTTNRMHPQVLLHGFSVLPAMVEGFGRELVPHLIAYVEYADSCGIPACAPELTLIGEALSSIPTDDAMNALIRWKKKEPLDRFYRLAAQSYPERAARLDLSQSP